MIGSLKINVNTWSEQGHRSAEAPAGSSLLAFK